MFEEFINQKVLVRGINSGVYVGVLDALDGQTAELSNLRNIYTWEGASCLSQVALEGTRGGKVSQEISKALITDVCQIFPLSEMAQISIDKVPAWRV